MKIDRTICPNTNSLVFSGFPEFEKTVINGNTPCFSFKSDTSNVVRVNISIPSGQWNFDKNLIANTSMQMLLEGTKKYTGFQIAEIIDFCGAYVETMSGMHHTNIYILALKDVLKDLFPIIQSILIEPIFDEKELKTILNNGKQEFLINEKKVMNIARRFFPSMIYGNEYPYGKILTKNDFNNIKKSDLQTFFNHLPIANSSIYIGGNVNDKIIQSLEKVISKTHSSPIIDKYFEISPTKEQEKLIDINDAIQSAIIIGSKTIGRSHADFPLLALTNTILGGYFGSRLMKKIREEKGYTYGINSSINSNVKTSHWAIQTQVNSEVTTNAVDEIFNEIKRLSTEKITLDELNIARNFLLGSVLRGMDGPFALMEKLKTLHYQNINPKEYLENYWEKIEKATPENVLEIAKKYFQSNETKTLIVGKKI